MWAWIGALLSALGTGVALYSRRAPQKSVIASEVYGMTARSHGRFAALSVLFGVTFVAGAFAAAVPVVPLLALYVLALALYAASFARGFS